MRSSRTPRRSTRSLAASIALVCLLGQVLAYAHLALVRHETCPEHGELIERGAVASARPAGPALSPSAVSFSRVLASEQSDSVHEHCSFCLQRREQLASVSGATLRWVLPRAQTIHSACSYVPRSPGVALFRLAPKQSPPA